MSAPSGVDVVKPNFPEGQALDTALRRAEASGEAFFKALQESSKNAAQLGHQAMRDIRKLEQELERSGALGLSFLVRSKEMETSALQEKLADLETQSQAKETQRKKLHDTLTVLEQELSAK